MWWFLLQSRAAAAAGSPRRTPAASPPAPARRTRTPHRCQGCRRRHPPGPTRPPSGSNPARRWTRSRAAGTATRALPGRWSQCSHAARAPCCPPSGLRAGPPRPPPASTSAPVRTTGRRCGRQTPPAARPQHPQSAATRGCRLCPRRLRCTCLPARSRPAPSPPPMLAPPRRLAAGSTPRCRAVR